ncbi:alpha/beta fold hydrolase [Panacagrimonas sp.]|uniref:alpha/beta fold hydrolase n=1 Tax=Panacagrimonas sp. TaxID=2480088 RepID=UPI003B52AFBC
MPVTAFTGREQSVTVWNGTLDINVRILGSGPPLVYLHPAAGLVWDSVLDTLAKSYTVYAPEHPGTGANHTTINKVDTWWELLMMYEQLFRELGLQRPVVVGQSYGGMMAADIAAMFPAAVGKLVLLNPIGLWRDDAPIPLVTLTSSTPDKLPAFLFHDVEGEGARSLFTPLPDAETNIKLGAAMVWALGCTGKFFWPIADYGLGRRLHRVTAPTLVIWGRQDALVPAVYAEEFSQRIAGSKVAMIDACGHIPQLEQPAQTLAHLREFLAGS